MKWKDEYSNRLCTAAEAVKIVKSGDKVILGQMHGISQILIDALCARKEDLMDVTVSSSTNFAQEHYLEEGYAPHIKYLNAFLFPAARKAYLAGRVNYLSIHFSHFSQWCDKLFQPLVAMPVLTPPDEDGYCSFSMNADYMEPACKIAKAIVAQINPSSPRTYGARIHVTELTHIVEHDDPLMEIPMGRAGEIEQKIAAHIAERVGDGACLQLGTGGIPDTVLSMLGDRKDLGIHTELFSDGVVNLYEKGVINCSKKQIDTGKIVTNFIVGTKKVHKFVNNNPDVLVMPVNYTNDPYIISKNDNFVSINSCLEVDLLGQVNSDTINGQPFSGIGGQVDFVRGAFMSKNGQSFICLPSTALNHTVSRIVPILQNPVTTSRFDVQTVVTEYGIADLWGRSYPERARALINIAHPAFRDELEAAARKAHILH